MELAINSFLKGLQIDNHPMVQGNDVLSDVLNGTFIAMNGNEIVLLNDMGNRRVDNAYLPAGYQPVGIKEHGGIIYVAAYNPITNRSLIGSFPSPERKMGVEYNDLKGEFDLFSIRKSDNYTEESDKYKSTATKELVKNIKFLKADSFLVRLTEDHSLHAGDKFSVYTTYNSDNFPTTQIKEMESTKTYYKLSNFDNVKDEKVISPKNREYTLSLGVLNSLNEFVDITKTLQRWGVDNSNDNYNKILDLEGKSDLYKFNAGYFIAPGAPASRDYDLTKNDKTLLLERLKIAVNTYAYKLVGPLYLKIALNHIETASYNIYGIKEGTNVTLWVESVITYNCPDGMPDENTAAEDSNRGSDDNYSTYYLYTNEDTIEQFDFPGFNFFYKLGNAESYWLDDVDLAGNYRKASEDTLQFSNHTYNPETNLYTITIKKKYVIENNEGNIDYYYCVPAASEKGLNPPEMIYLKGLSEKGTIEVNLLGSGQIDITGWRFYNNGTETILTYNLKAYPKYGKGFSNLKFTFTNVENNKKIILTEENGLTIFNGRNDIQFNWSNLGFEERSLYNVEISYDDGDEIKTITDKWFLTTELFNNCYRPSHEDYLADYCATDEHTKGIIEKYCTIDLEFSIERITNNSQKKEVTITGGKILVPEAELEDDKIEIEYKHQLDVNIEIRKNLTIKNENLYPKYVEITKEPEFSVSSTLNKDDIISQINFKNGKPDDWNMVEVINSDGEVSTKNTFESNISNTGNILITGKIDYYDKYTSTSKKATNLTIRNGFTTLSDAIDLLVNLTNLYYGIYLTMEANGGDDDYDINVISNSPSNFADRSSGDNLIHIDHQVTDLARFQIKDLYEKIKTLFNDANPDNIFIWAGIKVEDADDDESGGTWPAVNISAKNDSPGNIKSFARIWCRGKNPSQPWLLLETPLIYTKTVEDSIINKDIQATIKKHFQKVEKLYICFYDTKDLNGFYVPDPRTENYNFEYNLQAPITVKIKLKKGKIYFGEIVGNVYILNEESGENAPVAPITFKLKNERISLVLELNEINLDSSIEFLNIVSSTSNLPSTNATIDGGVTKDINGNDLDVNSVYEKTEGGLIEVKDPVITPHLTSLGGQYFGFVFGKSNTISTGIPKYICDIRHGGEGHAYLSYVGVPMIKDYSTTNG